MFKGIFKKASIYFDTTPTKGSSNAVTSDGIARAIESGGGGSSYDDTELRNRMTTAESDIDDIQAVIPSNASSSNKLATMSDISGGSDIFNLDSLPLWNGDGDIGNLSPSTPPTAGRYRIIKSGAINATGFIDVLKNTGLNKIMLHTIFYDSNLTAWEYCRGGNISGNTVTWQTIKKATWGNA